LEITEAYILDRLRTGMSAAYPSVDGYSDIAITDETRLKCAAVLVPLVEADDGWHILYTRRTDRVERHKGQVSFPGGGCDTGETMPEQTALREAEEEIGIDPAGVRVLGRLPNMITITAFRVTPVVGVIRWPAVFRLGENEVERVFTIPLRWLADRGNRWEFRMPGRNGAVIAYHPYDGELLWGATARMTVDFLDVLGL
jgi:8-oxo-dGTP pyrophosphatase MutT (NUDIX family)